MRSLITIVESLLEYQEERGSTFIHDGKEYDINAVFDIEDELPLYDIPVSALEWVLEYDTPNPARKRRADDTVPILITIWECRLVVLDGLHRLARALDDGLTTLPARFLPACILPHFEYGRVGEVDTRDCQHADLYQVGDEWFFGDAPDDAMPLAPDENEDFSIAELISREEWQP